MIKAASSFSSLIILAAASCGIVTAQTTQRLTATKANEYALVYSLPVTRLNVTIEAEITVKKPGEFYKYAKKYLNIDNPITPGHQHRKNDERQRARTARGTSRASYPPRNPGRTSGS